jgi:hypothetical protein
MNPDEIDLTEAGYTYLISNTPLFLIRRLQDEPSVPLLQEECSGEDLYSGLARALGKEPESSAEAVRPFAYLIALRNQESPDTFFRAAELRSEFHPWFKTAARLLEATYVPNVNTTLLVPNFPEIGQFSNAEVPISNVGKPANEAQTCSG